MATTTMYLYQVMELTDDIGLNDYPIFDEVYREGLNQKIVDHYLNQEIGVETISMFRHAMRRKMNEIMPYYNQLYKSEQLTFDPLNSVDIRNWSENKGKAESTEDSETGSTSESKTRTVASEFPQQQLGGAKDYATAAQDSESATTATGTGKGTSVTNQDGTTETLTTGFQGNRSALLMDYRQTFLNLDMEIINDLRELFMLIWANGDSYTGGNPYNGRLTFWYGFPV